MRLFSSGWAQSPRFSSRCVPYFIKNSNNSLSIFPRSHLVMSCFNIFSTSSIVIYSYSSSPCYTSQDFHIFCVFFIVGGLVVFESIHVTFLLNPPHFLEFYIFRLFRPVELFLVKLLSLCIFLMNFSQNYDYFIIIFTPNPIHTTTCIFHD